MVFAKGFIRDSVKPKQQIYKYGHMLPVLSVSDIYASNKHRSLIQQLYKMSGLEEEYFEAVYRPVIEKFAEFVQVLPSTHNGALSGLLNEGLARAFTAINILLQEGQKRAEPIYLYGVFTAGLFIDLSKVITNQKIILCDEEGNYLDEWQPFISSMVGIAPHYKIYPRGAMYQRLEIPLLPILARQLMPETGFNWLASDLRVFTDWIDALRNDEKQGGRITHAIWLYKYEDFLELLNSLSQVPVEMRETPGREHGEQFLIWLRDAIENGDIKINTPDSEVHLVEEGLFISNTVFEHFAKQQMSRLLSSPVNFQAVRTQFGNLFGIASKGGGDFLHAQYFSETPGGRAKDSSFSMSGQQRSLRDGMVLADPSIVIKNAQIPALTHFLRAMQAKSSETARLPNISRATATQADIKPSNQNNK